jgi:hypothetical protein
MQNGIKIGKSRDILQTVREDSKRRATSRFLPKLAIVAAAVGLLNFVSLNTSPAQQNALITIRIIDQQTGKPLTQRGVLVYPIDTHTHQPLVGPSIPFKGDTDDEGKVSFSITTLQSILAANDKQKGAAKNGSQRDRLSEHLDLQVIYASGGIQCSTGLFSLDEIVASGIVGDNHHCGKVAIRNAEAKPGEIVIFVARYHWWKAGQT